MHLPLVDQPNLQALNTIFVQKENINENSLSMYNNITSGTLQTDGVFLN